MGLIGYLILGGVVYAIGFTIHLKILAPKRQQGIEFGLMHPTIVALLISCFVMMLLVSVLLGKFVLKHEALDVAFILVNSLVATIVFYFGINPDQTQMNLPQ